MRALSMESENILIPPEYAVLKYLDPPINLWMNEAVTLCWLASMAEYGIVEIGAYKGKSAAFLASGSRLGQGVPVYCVDTWETRPPFRDEGIGHRVRAYSADGVYDTFCAVTAPFGDLVRPLKGYSIDIAQRFDSTIDLLFIDGDHGAAGEDFEAWFRRVAKGGVVAFHDIDLKAVRRDVRAIKKRRLLKDWQTVGRLIYGVKR